MTSRGGDCCKYVAQYRGEGCIISDDISTYLSTPVSEIIHIPYLKRYTTHLTCCIMLFLFLSCRTYTVFEYTDIGFIRAVFTIVQPKTRLTGLHKSRSSRSELEFDLGNFV